MKYKTLILNKISEKNIIFDLDGTIIDSAAGILNSIELTLKEFNKESKTPINSSLIGPPIRETFKKILNEQSDEDMESLINFFKKSYDESGFLQSKLYPGILEILNNLIDNKKDIYLATNKRKIPTRKILENLKIEKFFKKIFTIDAYPTEFSSKKELLSQLILDTKINIYNSVYVGDREEDKQAALANNLKFIFADWGYSK